MRRCLAPVLLLAALPLLAATREVQTVEVVQVPVYVSTSHGAVAGLTRENFELFVNGKPQPFDYFDVIDFGSAAAPAAKEAAPADPRQRRLYLLLFDLYYSSPKDVHRAQKAALELVTRRAPSDVFAVGTFTSHHGVEVIVPFTRDAVAVERAVAALRPSSAADPLRLVITEQEARPFGAAFDREQLPEILGRQLRAADELLVDLQRIRVDDQIDALRLLADRLAPLEGQKHVVLLSAGYSAELLHGVTAAAKQRGDIRQGPIAEFAMVPRAPQFIDINGTAMIGLRQMVSSYARAEVFLDAIDVAGLRHTWTIAENESLYTLTRDTGGSVIDNRNDLAEALEVLIDRQRVVYVLGFHARGSSRKDNRIEVRLRNVDGNPTLRYRPSYGPAPADDADNGLRLADILMNDTPQHGVAVTAAATGSTVSVAIPARELMAQVGDKSAAAEAMIYIFSGNRVVATNVHRIDVAPASPPPPSSAIRFEHTFDLPPGEYAAKVLVRLGDALGFARADFDVPAK